MAYDRVTAPLGFGHSGTVAPFFPVDLGQNCEVTASK